MPDHVDAARLLRDKEELLVRERRKREELARSNEVKDRFIAALAHDLRAPINAILDWVQLLQRETLDTSTRRQVLKTIELNAATQVALIDELPDLSRIGSDRRALGSSFRRSISPPPSRGSSRESCRPQKKPESTYTTRSRRTRDGPGRPRADWPDRLEPGDERAEVHSRRRIGRGAARRTRRRGRPCCPRQRQRDRSRDPSRAIRSDGARSNVRDEQKRPWCRSVHRTPARRAPAWNGDPAVVRTLE